jgi:L-ascorbate metabolism protein UlaG (beta-lactamase superfamily)
VARDAAGPGAGPLGERPDRLTWLGHSTAVIDLDGVRLVTDPVLRARVGHLRRMAAPARAPGAVDAVLISHLHLDHLHGPSLRRLEAATVVAPRGARRLLRRAAARIEEVGEGDEVAVGPVKVRAVHADHDGRRMPGRGRFAALGYLVTGSTVVYFPGDTGLFPGMADLAGAGIDLALLPVWGWGPTLGPGHLDPESAARALALLRPRRVVPIHWGTYAAGWTRRRRPPAFLRDPPREFAAHAARLAPEVEVVVLPPGGTLPLGA